MPYLDKMEIKIEDIIFWIIIIITVSVVIWILHGSPPIENSFPSLIAFIIASEVLLWKAIYKIDKRTSNGFMKIKTDLKLIRYDMNNKLNETNHRLDSIESLIRRRK